LTSSAAGTHRVLHVSQPSDAGVAVVVRRLVRDQSTRGWEVAVACDPAGALAGWVDEAGGTVLPWTARRSPGPGTVTETARLRSIVRAWGPDSGHLHSAKAGLAGRLAVRGGVCTVFQPHAWSFLAVSGPMQRLVARWERVAARWADAVVCVSEGERATGIAAGIRANFVLAPNGVDLSAFPPAGARERSDARATLGLDPTSPLAVCVGRLCRQKGQDVLLDAWPAIAAAVPNASLALVGDGPDAASLHARSSPHVRVVGATTDVQRWYAAADVVVQPSRWEVGAPLTVLEAMATGRSVVLSDVPGAHEVLQPGMGALCPVEDPKSLAEAVVTRLADPGLTATEGAAGTRQMASLFSLARTNQRVGELYDEVCAQRRRAAPPPGARPPRGRPGGPP
jgi:YD repeat-containing protein